MNQTNCNFPYYNNGNDCVLYKDVVGQSYQDTQKYLFSFYCFWYDIININRYIYF